MAFGAGEDWDAGGSGAGAWAPCWELGAMAPAAGLGAGIGGAMGEDAGAGTGPPELPAWPEPMVCWGVTGLATWKGAAELKGAAG